MSQVWVVKEHKNIKDNVFSEWNDQWPGQAMSLAVEEVLHDAKSDFQHVVVFKSKTWGNVLVLDGVIQCTERDECAYQEMIAHIPLFSHSNPENVLVIGGGDGGVIREVLRHETVKHVTICEIDKMVIDVSKKYLPSMAQAYEDKRVNLICDDAFKYLQLDEVKGKFDVVICDSSDPVGPAQALFELPFYKMMHDALRPGGRVCTQGESMWCHLDMIKNLIKGVKNTFPTVEYATTQIPTYPCGQIGFIVCSLPEKGKENEKVTSKLPVRQVPEKMQEQLKYYTSELHQAAFILPAFVARAVKNA